MNFVCFYAQDKFSGRQLRTFRICAQEGDILEIKTGDLFVNKQLFDHQINVQHNYKISRTDYENIKSLLLIDEESLIEAPVDSLIIPLSDRFASIHKLTNARVILPNNYEDEEIMKTFSHHWNQDNFGPVSIPTGKYFVLGDNRNNALDSRYLGFIDKSEVVATVLWK